jgi:hypothetical protein
MRRSLRAWAVLARSGICLLSCGSVAAAQDSLTVAPNAAGDSIIATWNAVPGTARYTITLDDAAGMRTPVLVRDADQPRLAVGLLEAGLAPGVRYFARVSPGAAQGSFRVRRAAPPDPLDRAYLLALWEHAGRPWLERYGGVSWDGARHTWLLDTAWAEAAVAGAQAYYLEYALRPAVNIALETGDTALIDEMAGFHLTHLRRFATLGAMRGRRGLRTSTALLDQQGSDAARTLPWLQPGTLRDDLRECQLCDAQFFHPVARLIRVISMLPPEERTPVMDTFVSAYAHLIVNEHLLRMVYDAEWTYWDATELPKHLIDIWRATTNPTRRPRHSYEYGVQDWDLWYIATTAEMLGAEANDPGLVGLSGREISRLQRLVTTGIALLQSHRTLYTDTRDLRGDVVASASYFNGDQDDHGDMAYAGYDGAAFPAPQDAAPPRGGSWDISHAYRIPVLFRALYDNRKATGGSFPMPADLALIANEYVYRVFRGDFARPVLRNFFDGHDAWHRVNREAGSGYPPSLYCDMRVETRPCLTVAGVFGWGLLDFVNPDLGRLRMATLELALTHDADRITFRDRYYRYAGSTFSAETPDGRPQYPFLLLALLAETADRAR